jgi:N6-adenosine-specific RNA methylase IME4
MSEIYKEKNMNSKFSIIVCDPPWNFNDTLAMSSVKRGAKANYNTMALEQIKNLPIKPIYESGSLLCLWVPSALLAEGLLVMNSWGFSHKQTYIWVKTKKNVLKSFHKKIAKKQLINMHDCLNFGLGRLFRQTHEICLIGTNNNNIYKILKNKSQRSVMFAPNLKHSAKPELLQDSLDLMFPEAQKLELFARRQRPRWLCLGNEAPMTTKEDIVTSLKKLANIDTQKVDNLFSIINEYNSSKDQLLFDTWAP